MAFTSASGTNLGLREPDNEIAVARASFRRHDGTKAGVRVQLTADPNGYESDLRLEGLGIGRHTGYVRLWPDDQNHELDFEGDVYTRHLGFVADAAILVIDDNDEIRLGTFPGEEA